ncbi:hypothetical protein Psyc_1209 [Psychrobacter arcticus 273-4]|uniref:Uncharacterized protein n=1 Tax=Psychrobacter arcticus (strain DSM 17307 / VKM B-2377 / 273-4) TaxID=259536 RepID=Q4FSE8_PSYA2|nr:hypothetical protein [Psychrobacter arcticus]AAZ19060.1 hypothetical protein Psyc_1209 [Psychrobacter arcticus 273-4]
MNNKKSIILALPEDAGLSNLIAKNFEYHGFDVIYYRRQPYKYKRPTEKIANFFRKNIFGDKGYKNRQQDKEALEKLNYDIMERKMKIDYALFIRPDTFSIEFIKKIKGYVNKTIGYQWDGLDRFPDVFDRIEVFNDFYVFDPKDILNHPEYDLKLTTNFYFDIDQNPILIKNEAKKTIYFVGSHLPQRVSAINKFIESADKLNLQINFLIRLKQRKIRDKSLYNSECINFINENIDYSENLNNVKDSDILIDFVNNVHSGLSFRIFESIFYQKKLITNNTEVSKYDLYHEDNIYIWDNEKIDIDSLRDFLNKPYYILPSKILNKYSFKTWYSSVLGIDENQ